MAETRDINLLPFEEKAQESFANLQKRLSLVSVIVLVVTAIFTLVTLVFFTSLASSRSKLIEDAQRSFSTINSYKANEELIVVVKNKVSAADKILNERANYSNVFNTLTSIIPQGTYFTDFKVASEKVSITGRAKSSADVAGLVSSLVSDRGKEIISNLSVESLSSDDKGIYAFVLSAQLVSK